MKKVVLLACVMVVSGFASSCYSEKSDYERALKCYQNKLEGRTYSSYCRSSENTLAKARERLEKAKVKLEICLVRESKRF